VFSRDADAPVHVVPMRVIHRPLPSELDEDKVQAFMEEMKVGYSVCGS
jgi:sulfiredoxin